MANGDIYEFASTSSRQNDLTDWIANLVESHGQDLPTAAAQALAQLTDSTLQLDSNTTIFFVFVLSNGQRIFVTWNKNQPHPEISELRDANNNTVPRSPGQVGGTYSFSGHTTEYARFINYLGQMGVSIEEPSGGSLWIVACTTAGGVTRCVPVRSY